MPRFFFDVRDRIVVPDEVGQELSNLDRARTLAAVTACEIGRDLLPTGEVSVVEIQVRDATGQRVLTVTLSMRES
jgi:hypothetical protein